MSNKLNHRNPNNPLPSCSAEDRENYPIINIDTGSMASMSDAIAMGVASVEGLAELLITDLIEDCLVPDYSPIVVSDGQCAVEYDADEYDADEAAQEYVDSGNWFGDEPRLKTEFLELVSYRVGIRSDGRIEHVDSDIHIMTLDPEVPDCIDKENEHDWQSPVEIVGGCNSNPGVSGHGGGVFSASVCVKCGCGRMIDTWADGPSGIQGMTTEEYEPGKYVEEVRKLHLETAVSELQAEFDPKLSLYYYTTDNDENYQVEEDEMVLYGLRLISGDDAELPGKKSSVSEE